MPRRPNSFVVDTDIFIDYLKGIEGVRGVIDSFQNKIYYSVITRKELLAKPGLSSTERERIEILLLKHRIVPVDENIAEKFSILLQKYAQFGLRNADALVAATAWSRNFPLFTRNIKHYRFIAEIRLANRLKAR